MTARQKFDSKWTPEPFSGCWLWTGGFAGGYGAAYFPDSYHQIRAHRLAWILYKGTIPHGLWLLHRCDTPACVNPDHLFLGTRQDNANDCISKNRHFHKLLPNEVLEIRKSSKSTKQVAKLYGIASRTVHQIRTRETWKWI